MSADDPQTAGELVKQAKALGTTAYVGPDGRVWRLKYLGEVDMSDWLPLLIARLDELQREERAVDGQEKP